MEKHFSSLPFLPSSVASQYLWHNKYIKIDDKTIFSSSLSAKGINFVGQLFQNNVSMFQYKLLNNVLYLNNMLFRFRKNDSLFCSYCNEQKETPLHLFHSCLKIKQLWNKLRQYLTQFINIPHSILQSAIVGIFDNNQHSMLINHLSLIFKFYIYSARNTKQSNFDNLKITIKKIKELEKELTISNKLKLVKKWRPN